MIIKKEQYKKCPECGSSEFVKDTIYGCDCCKKVLDTSNKKLDYLRTTLMFNSSEENKDYIFCSWRCFFSKMRTIKSNYFISLPFLHCDKGTKGTRVNDFWECIKKFPVKKEGK